MYNVDTQLLYIAAFRYALGRSTYVVPTVANVIRNNRHELSNETAKLMVREIEDCRCLGDECDAEVWRGLAEFLSEGLNEND